MRCVTGNINYFSYRSEGYDENKNKTKQARVRNFVARNSVINSTPISCYLPLPTATI